MSQSYPQKNNRPIGDYLSEDTVASVITAVGGPVCVVRVSGSKTKKVLETLCGGFEFTPRKTHLKKLKNSSGKVLDEALIVFFQNPESFTGEDVAEISLHGSGLVVEEVFKELKALGARQALPGEFSFRAVKNGKMDLSQARAVADLISSKNSLARDIALERLSGSETALVSELSEEMFQLVTLSELGIDFSDQDIDEVGLDKLKDRVKALDLRLLLLEQSFERGKRIQEGVSLALAGAPNAGKSSLFNVLLGEDRAIVTEIAGTTRDVLREALTLKNQTHTVTLRIEDTAGLRQTANRVEAIGIERTKKAVENADLVLFIVDASVPVDEALLEWKNLGVSSEKVIGVLNKSDLTAKKPDTSAFGIKTWSTVSSLKLTGIDELTNSVIHYCTRWITRSGEEFILTREDQRFAVSQARASLERALKAKEPELFSADVRQCLVDLKTLLGEVSTDEILGRIFSQFCIGK